MSQSASPFCSLNHENMPTNKILVALQILPSPPQQQSKNAIVETSENHVVLSSIPKSPIFPFDLVLWQKKYNQYLLDKIPKLIIEQLTEGHNTSIIFYDALAVNNRFDTRLILALTSLFELEDHQVYVKFVDYNEQHAHDLISAGKSNSNNYEYRIDTIDLALKYYIFGSEQHTKGLLSVYSIIIKNSTRASQFNLIDMSGCPNETLTEFSNYCSHRNSSVPLTSIMEESSSSIFLACLSQLDPVLQLEHTLNYSLDIFDRLNYRNTSHLSSNTSNSNLQLPDDPENLRRIIAKLSNEVSILRSNSISSTQSSKHGSMFSSMSHSTSATLPDIAEEKEQQHVLADLYRQIEELENQVTVTRERNEHVERELSEMKNTNVTLWELGDKQSAMIDALESQLGEAQVRDEDDLNEIRRELQNLGMQRFELQGAIQVVENKMWQQDNDTAKALDELVALQQQIRNQQFSDSDDNDSESLVKQRTRALESRVEELDNYIERIQVNWSSQEETEKWKHASVLQAAKAADLEKKMLALEDELDMYRKTIAEGDASGLVARLEEKVLQLEGEKDAIASDFETSYEAAINETEELTQLANQQARQIQQLEAALADAHQQMSDNKSIKQAFDALQEEYEALERLNEELSTKKQPLSPSLTRQSMNSIASSVNTVKKKISKRQSVVDKNQLMHWMQEKLDNACSQDVLQKVSLLADENIQLSVLADDLEEQLTSQRHHLSQQIKTLECDVMNLTMLKNQLERQMENKPRASRSSIAMMRLRRDETSSVHSDMSRYRSTTPNVPPPTEPPSQPLPPTPPATEQYTSLLRNQKTKIDVAENEIKTQQQLIQKLETQIVAAENKQQEMQQQFINIQKDLDFERRQKQKVEKAHAILEQRLQDVMNKKNKFLCF